MPRVTIAQYNEAKRLGVVPPIPEKKPLADAAQVNVVQQFQGQEVENVFYFHQDGGYDETGLLALATLVSQKWVADILPIQSADLTLVRVRAKDISVVDGAFVDYLGDAGAAGSLTGSYWGTETAAGFNLTTAVAGRGNTGMKRLAGIPSALSAAGAWTSGAVSTMGTAMANFLAHVNSVPNQYMIVVSFYLKKVAKDPPTWRPVISIDLRPLPTTQNSRKVGRGA